MVESAPDRQGANVATLRAGARRRCGGVPATGTRNSPVRSRSRMDSGVVGPRVPNAHIELSAATADACEVAFPTARPLTARGHRQTIGCCEHSAPWLRESEVGDEACALHSSRWWAHGDVDGWSCRSKSGKKPRTCAWGSELQRAHTCLFQPRDREPSLWEPELFVRSGTVLRTRYPLGYRKSRTPVLRLGTASTARRQSRPGRVSVVSGAY